MANVWMKFNLDDEWDMELYERVQRATDLCSAIWDIKILFREEWRKLEDGAEEETHGKVIERIEKEFYEILNVNGIDIDKIYS